MTEESFERVLAFATSVTFDIKACDDEVHHALTGASVAPVLRNAELIGREHPDPRRRHVEPESTNQGSIHPPSD